MERCQGVKRLSARDRQLLRASIGHVSIVDRCDQAAFRTVLSTDHPPTRLSACSSCTFISYSSHTRTLGPITVHRRLSCVQRCTPSIRAPTASILACKLSRFASTFPVFSSIFLSILRKSSSISYLLLLPLSSSSPASPPTLTQNALLTNADQTASANRANTEAGRGGAVLVGSRRQRGVVAWSALPGLALSRKGQGRWRACDEFRGRDPSR